MPYANQINGCQIWRDYEGVGFHIDKGVAVEHSPRAGIKYLISQLQDGELRIQK